MSDFSSSTRHQDDRSKSAASQWNDKSAKQSSAHTGGDASLSSAKSSLNPASLKIMVVDDSKTIRQSASSLLAEEGWHVITAEDGFDALGKVVASQPDLVFADVSMPRLDGYQTCALIKNNPAYRDIPVVMLSSKDSIFDKARGRIVGSEHYLTKPFTRRDLVRAVQRHTRAQERQQKGVAQSTSAGSQAGQSD